MMDKIIMRIKDSKDVLVVADALLKSGYTVATPKKKVGGKYEQYVVAVVKPDSESGEQG